MSHYNLWLALTEIQSITFLLGSSQIDPYHPSIEEDVSARKDC